MTDDEDLLEPILPAATAREKMLERLDILATYLWEGAMSRTDVEQWLENFDGSELTVEAEQLNALHLLCNFNLFGVVEVRELLKALYRDLFRYPIVQRLREQAGGSLDPTRVAAAYQDELRSTRFLGMGNPSESGAHLLYYFRQVNKLSKDLFVHQHEIFDGPVGAPTSKIAIDNLTHVVFIDDVLSSGNQAREYSEKFVKELKTKATSEGRTITVEYFVLFAKGEGLSNARSSDFDRVEAVHELQPSELAFSDNSRVYVGSPDEVSRADGLRTANSYGERLYPGHALGYQDGQLLLGFRHNIPDNTLPIIWMSEGPLSWKPAFIRFGKF